MTPTYTAPGNHARTAVPYRASAWPGSGDDARGRGAPLAGKVVLITGAGSGIGRAVAEQVAGAGGRLVLIGRRRPPLEQVGASLSVPLPVGNGTDVLVAPADVGRADAVASVVSDAIAHFGHVDAIVNNAGCARFGPLERASLDDLEFMLDAHLRGPIHLIRACLSSLRERRGSVVNISSVGGVLATPHRAMYGATKAALNHLTRSLARELAPDVRVNAILPGPVETPMYDDLGLAEEQRWRLREEMIAATPSGRFARPEEVARWVCHLLADESAWVTGALFAIDGGRTA